MMQCEQMTRPLHPPANTLDHVTILQLSYKHKYTGDLMKCKTGRLGTKNIIGEHSFVIVHVVGYITQAWGQSHEHLCKLSCIEYLICLSICI